MSNITSTSVPPPAMSARRSVPHHHKVGHESEDGEGSPEAGAERPCAVFCAERHSGFMMYGPFPEPHSLNYAQSADRNRRRARDQQILDGQKKCWEGWRTFRARRWGSSPRTCRTRPTSASAEALWALHSTRRAIPGHTRYVYHRPVM